MKVIDYNSKKIRQNRIDIVQDVLDDLNAQDGIMVVKRATGYFQLPAKFNFKNLVKTFSLKDLLLQEKPQCTVCAQGAFFCAYVMKHNKFQIGELTDSTGGFFRSRPKALHIKNSCPILERLNDVFSEKMLTLIECAFEHSVHNTGNVSWDDLCAAKRMYPESWGANKILRAICQNIIDNNGDFVVKAKV